MAKAVTLIGNVDLVDYSEDQDAYLGGVVVPDDAQVVVTDLVVVRPNESAAIHYVIQMEQRLPDPEPEDDDEAPQPE